MSTAYKGNQSHAFQRIEKDMKSGDIPGVVLLCGKEEYLTDHYMNSIMDRFTDPATRQMDITQFTGEEVRGSNIVDAAETMPLLSQKKVVLLPRVINSKGKLPKHLEESGEEQDAFFDAIDRIPEHALLVMTAEKPRSSGDYKKQSDGRRLSKLSKAVEKAGGQVYDFDPLERAQLRNFVVKRFKSADKTCTNGVLQRIIYETGYGSRYTNYDLYLLENDLKKMIAIVGDREMITEEDGDQVLTKSPENNVFHMLDAISRGRSDQALIDLNTLMEDGESLFGILANLIKQLEIMLIAREMTDENIGRNDIVRYLQKEERIAEYRAKKALETANRFRREQLKKMLMNALAIDTNIKEGIMDSRLAMEYFITA